MRESVGSPERTNLWAPLDTQICVFPRMRKAVGSSACAKLWVPLHAQIIVSQFNKSLVQNMPSHGGPSARQWDAGPPDPEPAPVLLPGAGPCDP